MIAGRDLVDRVRGAAHRARPREYFYRQWDAEPFSLTPLTLLDQQHEAPPSHRNRDATRLVHVANFGKNAGDRLLPIMTRDVIAEDLGPHRWLGRAVHHRINRADLALINRGNGLVIGGGGLFLRDTNPNDLSGWQWSCSPADLRRIEVPIVVFAVGYNRFRGQDDFSPRFVEHLSELTRRSVYVGLRNTGSIDAVRSYLPAELHDKVRLQPCATTLATHLYPGPWTDWPDPLGPSDRPVIGVNCAFDREELRYGERRDEILASIADGLSTFADRCRIVYYAHRGDDERALPALRAQGLDPEVLRLHTMDAASILNAYRRADVVLGMRGHAQMIPFGCGRPILSLVSHDKMRFFLDDTDLSDVAVEVHDRDLRDQVVAKLTDVLDDPERWHRRIADAQDRLWAITRTNVADATTAFAARAGR